MADTQCEAHTPFNLEHFLGHLTLEPMVRGRRAPSMPPPNGRSTKTPLIMRPGGIRKLSTIKVLDGLDHEVMFFYDNLPIAADGEAFENLKLTTQVPTRDMEKNLFFNPYEVEANSSALFVIERGPIKSVQQLVRTIDSDLNDLAFFTPSRLGTLNAQKIEPAFFCTMDESGGMESVKCIVIAMPPWEFAPQDFVDFTTMDTFVDGCTSKNGMSNDPPWSNADRMWAYLHDLCFMHDCHHFVVTSYEQWAFGAFSTYYTTGFVSRISPWNSKPRSILEMFTYWILDACGVENTMMMEQVPKEQHLDCDVLERERSLCRQRIENEELMSVGLSHTINEQRPLQRACKDPLEDRMGWGPLPQHADALFLSSQKPSKPITLERDDEQRDDMENKPVAGSFAKPHTEWNRWYMRKPKTKGKENPHSKMQKPRQNEKSPDHTPKLAARPQSGPPIPCYSLDVDRNNDCFRPGPIGFKSFPIPSP